MKAGTLEDLEFDQAVVMMVDDEPIVMDVLETCLEEHGYRHFIKIEDSRLALEAIATERPDVVLLDLNMPNIDGFGILKQLRSKTETRFLSVIVLTSSNDSATKLRALELGATDFLAKPIDRSELVLRIRNTLTVKAYQDQLAFYDTLTQLPNRKLFVDRVGWAIKCAERNKNEVAVLNIAIDRFQQVNEMLGPQAGDQLLVQVAQRLTRCFRDSDAVGRVSEEPSWRNMARLSGDEFSVLLTQLYGVEQIIPIAERIRAGLSGVFNIGEREVYVTASIGISTYPRDAADTDTLMQHAGAATAYAKEKGRDCHQFYSREINAIAQRRIAIEQSLRKVLQRNELELFYQPKIAAQGGEIIGMEALLRWFHPQMGTIPPFEFVPIAEEIGLINDIGDWVLREACRQTAQWSSQGLQHLSVSVNVSAHQFRDNFFPIAVQSALNDSGLPPEHLMIEITEGVLMGDKERIGDLLFKIKTTGAMLSIDDFGTGYSSLSYLKSFPIDELKIDRSFIIDVPDDDDSSAIVKAIVAMARGLGLEVVAEGVETEAQLKFLQALSCDCIQGYYFSKPLPADEFKQYCLGFQSGMTGA